MRSFKLVFQIAILVFCMAVFSENVQAKLFRNAYVQFELPAQWNCNLEGTEWVCSSQNKIDSKATQRPLIKYSNEFLINHPEISYL